jgi:hypothetical protein
MNNDDDRDFKWFVSGKANTHRYQGQYIAIWNEQIVAVGQNAVIVENIAKDKYGKDIHPLVIYIPEDEIVIDVVDDKCQ